MIPVSIRWRLPLSYAAIALLAALALGAVLLATLRSYYAQQEYTHLLNNARAISTIMNHAQLVEAPTDDLEARLKSFSFLSQVRVRLLNEGGEIIADSGSPTQHRTLSLAYSPTRIQSAPAGTAALNPDHAADEDLLLYNTLPASPNDTTADSLPSILIVSQASAEAVPAQRVDITPETNNFWVSVESGPGIGGFALLPPERTAVNFRLPFDERPSLFTTARSNQIVSAPIINEAGVLFGHVQLSDGPAYGTEIVNGVAQAWALSSAVAVLLAVGVGFIISRRISAPLLALTDVTIRMTGGDLTARAAVGSEDEVGILGKSFNQMAGRVEETITTLRRFVADAAHELHTPLTALRTNLELVASEDHWQTRALFIERAQAQVSRLEALTTDLLELSRIESGEMPHNGQTTTLDLTVLLRETSELYASQAEQAGIDFHMDIPQQAVTIHAHEGQLRRALCNLLENAIKFTPPGGTITIGLCQRAAMIEVWVQDTGIGIPEDDLPQLFSRFHRGRNALSIPGSGLGLAIVKAIAEYHHGQVMAENIGQGARLSLRLPA